MRHLLIASFFFAFSIARAQDTPGASVAGVGGTGSVSQDVWSAFYNQAGLAKVKSIQAGAFFQSRFAMKELSYKGVAVALPTKGGTLAINYKSFGYSAFTSDKTGLAFAMPFGEKLSAGVQLDYYSVRIAEGYGNRRTVGVSGGFQFKLTQRFLLAGAIENPNRSKLSNFNDERLPSIIRFGGAYTFSEKLKLVGEVRKPSNTNPQTSGGIEYKTSDSFVLRAGFNTFPATSSFGFGYNSKSFITDVAVAYNSWLGFSPQIALTYQVQRSK
jgi:hypothetical protein